MTAILYDLRIILSERLFSLAVRLMPEQACEREPLEQAHRIYCSDVAPYQRAVKFPA